MQKNNLFDACTMLEDAWNNVSYSYILNFWRKAEFILQAAETEDNENQAPDVEEDIVKLLENLGIDRPIAQSQARSLLEVGIEEENIYLIWTKL